MSVGAFVPVTGAGARLRGLSDSRISGVGMWLMEALRVDRTVSLMHLTTVNVM